MHAQVLKVKTGETMWIDSRLSRITRLQRRVRAWVEYTSARWPDGEHDTIMVTATYHWAADWRPRHISGLVKWLRGVWPMVAYCWVAELQRRGAIHYHVLCVVSKPYRRIKPDLEGGWCHGSTRTEKARTRWYIAKYTSKGADAPGEERQFPKGARILGLWPRSPDDDSESARAYSLSAHPAWVRGAVAGRADPVSVRRAVGGGYEIGGEHHASPYALMCVSRVGPDELDANGRPPVSVFGPVAYERRKAVGALDAALGDRVPPCWI